MAKDDKGAKPPAQGRKNTGQKNAEALAAALRANLLRRKAARPRPAPTGQDGGPKDAR
ncbi:MULTISPECIES: hypothetical protein [Methylosinus]|uniref:hypothetical protein n=1 Tax=Methylosinus TaxID=425 RepID=UPI0001D2E39B|nr:MULTISPECIES: hypothetical protein [Methylosinus]